MRLLIIQFKNYTKGNLVVRAEGLSGFLKKCKAAILSRPFLMLLLLWSAASAGAADHSIPLDLGPDKFPEETIEAFASHPSGGIITALLGAPRHRASNLQLSYFKSSEEVLDLKVFFGNYTKAKQRFRVYFLVDYVQVPFFVSEKKFWSFPFDLPLSRHRPARARSLADLLDADVIIDKSALNGPLILREERRVLDISLREIGFGAHDVIMVAIPEPVIQSNGSENGKNHNGVEPPTIRRFNVFSGSSEFPRFIVDDVPASKLENDHAPLARLTSGDHAAGHHEASTSNNISGIEINNVKAQAASFVVSVLTQDNHDPCSSAGARYLSIPARMSATVKDESGLQCLRRGGRLLIVEDPYFRLEEPHGKLVQREAGMELLADSP